MAPFTLLGSERVAAIGPAPAAGKSVVIGVLPGEGVGPQLTTICLDVLARVADLYGWTYEAPMGGPIGLESIRSSGSALSHDVCNFCEGVFERGGAILAGPGGERFVYDMRRRFKLYAKLNPVRSYKELAKDAHVQWRDPGPADIMIVRDNIGGLYQGCSETVFEDGERRVEHRFAYNESDVLAVTDLAASIASGRRGHLTVVAKASGIPALSGLWFDCGRRSAEKYGVALRTMDMDYAVYQFAWAPQEFDVIAIPNCFGDLLADLGGIICGSRGTTYGGSFSQSGAAVYQTNHGSANDLAGMDAANPAGQIFSLAMLLAQTYGRTEEASSIFAAVRRTWAQGWRTFDVMAPGRRQVGTHDFGLHVLENLRREPFEA